MFCEEYAMTRVFVLTNHKGGVGKSTSATTIALGIAAVLRRAGAAVGTDGPCTAEVRTDAAGVRSPLRKRAEPPPGRRLD